MSAAVLFTAGCPGAAHKAREGAERPLEERLRDEIAAYTVELADISEAREPAIVKSPSPVRPAKDLPLSGDIKSNDQIDISLVEKWFDSSKVYFTMLFRNVTDKGVRKRVYVFGYDKNGRILNSSAGAMYFQPKEQVLQNYNYKRNSGVTRWVITVR